MKRHARLASLLSGACLLVALAAPAAAREPFNVELTVNGNTGSRSFTSIEDAVNVLSEGGLRSITSAYTDSSPASVNLDFRGVRGFGSFTANSPVLRVTIPAAGIDETFNGATRDESRRLFERFVQGRRGDNVNALLRAGVRSSPLDPVAGGPNGLFAQFAAGDFNRSVIAAALGERSGFGIGARFGAFSAGGYNSTNISLPLDYTWRITDRDTLQSETPFSYTDDNGATSYAASTGLLYRRRVTDNWTLQASARVGAAGSVDLGAGSGVYGVGLNSALRIPLGDTWRITVANGINYVSTFPISVGDYRVDYNISNTIFRNGIVVTRDLGFEVAGLPVTGSAFAVDTRFTGSAVYIRDFQEFGVFLSAGRESLFGVGVSALTGARGLSGVMVNTGVKF